MPIITPDDLAPFATIERAKAEAMIADAEASARRVAPCLKDTDDADLIAAAKAILRRALLRWNEAGFGAVSQQSAGPLSQSTEVRNSRGLFWPTEITDLQGLCAQSRSAYMIDMTGFQSNSSPLAGATINGPAEGEWSDQAPPLAGEA